MTKPELTLERKLELLKWYYKTVYPAYTHHIFSASGETFDIEVTCPLGRYYEWSDKLVMEEDGRLRDQPALNYQTALHYLFQANTTDVERLIAFWTEAENMDWKDYHSDVIAEIKGQGHHVVDIKPDLLDASFCTVKCQYGDLVYYFHTDDGDVMVTQSPIRPWGHPDRKSHNPYPDVDQDFYPPLYKIVGYYDAENLEVN